ncbi:hypothetical protein [Phytohalomonas tamaricis]|uniref:hypothetical protein n=1 Tax=Phytohalomonas tamaricis TaxID=2081032 RepID=UPI000D0B23E5|nr:hypothetical protein [Phytohalomonas tamaricis]
MRIHSRCIATVLVTIALLSSAGCTSTQRGWSKENVNAKQYRKDSRECGQQLELTERSALPKTLPADAHSAANDGLITSAQSDTAQHEFNTCMYNRDWRLITPDEAASTRESTPN